jgi:hypoxia up-regulated 1
VNADEAAVLGAALRGAAASRQFRTKDIRLVDLTTYGAEVLYAAEKKNSGKAFSSLFI